MGKKILEISPQHEIIKKMKSRLDSDSSADMKDLVKLLYDLSLQSSGFTIENSSDFIKRVLNLINNDLTLFKSDNLEEIIAN